MTLDCILVLCEIPYSGKLWLFVKVFSAKFGDVVSFGAAQASNLRKFSPLKVSHYTVSAHP